MASLEDRNKLLEDRIFRSKLLACAVGKVRDVQTAEDIVSDTLLKLLLKDEASLGGIHDVEKYVFGMLHLVLLNYYKGNKTKILSIGEDHDMAEATGTDPLNQMLFEQIERDLRIEMPGIESNVFDLYFKKELGYKEIAGMLDKEQGYIRKVIYTIRQFVRNKFRNEQ